MLPSRCLLRSAIVSSSASSVRNIRRFPSALPSCSPNVRRRQWYSTERTIPVTEGASSPQSSNTYSTEEIDKFRSLGGDWWESGGSFKLLHSMNELRVPFIRDGIIQSGQQKSPQLVDGPKPLSNLHILDVGCGGGILSEPLARLGANVTGIDAGEEGIKAASDHCNLSPNLSANLTYHCTTIEQHSINHTEKYDSVVISEVLEHVPSVSEFVAECSKCLKPGGSLFITTINRTPQSYLGAIVAAECVMGLVPRGTHDWNMFIKVEELATILNQNGYNTRLIHGMLCLPFLDKWEWVSDTSVNYALHAIKTNE